MKNTKKRNERKQKVVEDGSRLKPPKYYYHGSYPINFFIKLYSQNYYKTSHNQTFRDQAPLLATWTWNSVFNSICL